MLRNIKIIHADLDLSCVEYEFDVGRILISGIPRRLLWSSHYEKFLTDPLIQELNGLIFVFTDYSVFHDISLLRYECWPVTPLPPQSHHHPWKVACLKDNLRNTIFCQAIVFIEYKIPSVDKRGDTFVWDHPLSEPHHHSLKVSKKIY